MRFLATGHSCSASRTRSWSGSPSARDRRLPADRTTFGRAVYAIGNRERAAYLSGIRTRLVVMRRFVVSRRLRRVRPACCSPATASKAYQAMGDPYLLPAIAAVVLGGTRSSAAAAATSAPWSASS